MQTQILISQMELFASLIVIGIFCQRIGLFTDENIDGVSAIMTKIIIPCLMITSMPNGATRDQLLHSGSIILVSACYIAGMIAISIVISRLIGIKDKAHRNMHAIISSFGNAGFIGAPLGIVVYPTEVVVGSIYLIMEALFCWAVGPMLADPEMKFKKSSLKRLINPVMIGAFIGVALTFLNVHPTDNAFWKALSGIAGSTVYFSCFLIGLKVGKIGFKKLFEEKRVLLSSLMKMIVFPLILFVILSHLNIFTPERLGIMMIMAATPTAISVVLVAEIANGDTNYAMAGTLLNTMLCLFTIPLVMSIIGL